jgi:hypothetical protein
MAKIKVKRVHAPMTISDVEPLWFVEMDYGGGVEVHIPLPAHDLITDGVETQTSQSLEAMESLAKALLDFVDQTRKRLHHDP